MKMKTFPKKISWIGHLSLLTGAIGVWTNEPMHAASTDPAKLLQQGKFREAQSGFEAMAERQPKDPRWRYNAGVAAFRAGDPTTAQKHFESATAAADLDLQQRAWYNLGNSWFQLATAPQSEERETALKNAEEAFGAAIQLTPQDRMATENLAAVKKLEEELKKQQQQDPQSEDGSKDKQKSKGQKGSKGQSSKNGKQDPQRDESEDSKSDQAKNPPDKSSKKDQASKPPKQQPGDEKNSGESGQGETQEKKNEPKSDVAQQRTNAPAGGSKTNQAAQASADKGKDKSGGEKSAIQRGEGSDAAGAEGQTAQLAVDGERMTVMQAQQMLDAQKGSEKPIWTLVRGWGQENQQAPSASTRRRTW